MITVNWNWFERASCWSYFRERDPWG